MDLHSYPGAEAHIAYHAEYTKTFNSFKTVFLTQDPSMSLTIKFRTLLVNWWLNHVTKVDKMLGEFLREKI